MLVCCLFVCFLFVCFFFNVFYHYYYYYYYLFSKSSLGDTFVILNKNSKNIVSLGDRA